MYVEFLVKTLKPLIDKRYRTLKDRNNTFIASSSMGAFISLYAGYKYKEILYLVTLCTSARENEKEKAEILSFASRLDGLDMNKFKLLTSPVLKVSSSEIRQKIKDGEDFSSLVPKKVYDYIIKRRIYNV